MLTIIFFHSLKVVSEDEAPAVVVVSEDEAVAVVVVVLVEDAVEVVGLASEGVAGVAAETNDGRNTEYIARPSSDLEQISTIIFGMELQIKCIRTSM